MRHTKNYFSLSVMKTEAAQNGTTLYPHYWQMLEIMPNMKDLVTLTNHTSTNKTTVNALKGIFTIINYLLLGYCIVAVLHWSVLQINGMKKHCCCSWRSTIPARRFLIQPVEPLKHPMSTPLFLLPWLTKAGFSLVQNVS